MFIKSKGYEVGIAEMLMSRQIASIRGKLLGPYNLSSIEWFILGLVQDKSSSGGIRVTDLALLLGVQTTYITASLQTLRAKGYVDTLRDRRDGRTRFLVITQLGSEVAAALEQQYRQTMEALLLGDVTAETWAHYLQVLQRIGQAKTDG